MQVYSLITQKGGAGKSTLARQLAVLAGESGPSLLIDRDPQRTTRKWWERRSSIDLVLERPELLDLGSASLTDAVKQLRRKPDGVLFIDTRPAVDEPEAEAARVADLVIVPVRPSPDDLEAVGATLSILRRLDRRAVVIVNAARNDARANGARAALSRYPVPVCPVHLADRTVYLNASLEGRGVTEMRGHAAKEAAQELRQIWEWVQETRNEQ